MQPTTRRIGEFCTSITQLRASLSAWNGLGSDDSSWLLAAGALDRVILAAIQGAADQMWLWPAVDRRAEAAAVNAVASGSQHRTIRTISQRIARSGSVSAPGSSPTPVANLKGDSECECPHIRGAFASTQSRRSINT
jgi:hypothetical protein